MQSVYSAPPSDRASAQKRYIWFTNDIERYLSMNIAS